MIPAPDLGRRNNFDLLRLVFATSVALVHAHVLSAEARLAPLSSVLSSSVAVNGFFAISGFLITRSHQRSRSLARYAEKRVRRIYPAYLVVIVATAALGLWVSDLGALDYLRAPALPRYLAANLSFLNFLQPTLPGVFAGNPTETAVNGALWSIRVEVLCYFGVPILCALARRVRPWIACGAALAVCAAATLWLDARHATTGENMYHLAKVELPVPVACFVAGALVCFHFDAFLRNVRPLLLAAGVVVAARYVPSVAPAAELLLPLALTILVLAAAIVAPPLGNFARHGDLSYGIYIWHFPVIQLLVARGAFAAHPIGALGLALLAVAALAVLSWNVVEKPFLRRDSHYKQASQG